MVSDDKTPLITNELIDYLDRAYPDKMPDAYHNEHELGMRMGEIRVVRHLKHLRDKQQRNVLRI